MGKNQDPGNGINIPDPPHWDSPFFLRQPKPWTCSQAPPWPTTQNSCTSHPVKKKSIVSKVQPRGGGAQIYFRVQGGLGFSVTIECKVSELVGSALPAIWQARVQIPARHPRGVFPCEQRSNEEKGERPRRMDMNVTMNV
jgi:hypothetical protein